MRRALFLNPPNHRFDWFDFAPPLGLLVLAQVAREEGYDAEVLDLAFPKYARLADEPDQFYATASRLIAQRRPDVV